MKLFTVTPHKVVTSVGNVVIAGYDVPALRTMLAAGNTAGWDQLMLAMLLRYSEVREIYAAAPVDGDAISREAVTAALELEEANYAAEQALLRAAPVTSAAPLTAETITRDEIEILRLVALAAGEARQVALCQLALGKGSAYARQLKAAGLVRRGDGWWRDAVLVGRNATEAARQLCADAINAARAAVAQPVPQEAPVAPLTAETITNEQIRELRATAIESDDRYLQRACKAALGLTKGHPNIRRHGRQQCADAINTSRAAAARAAAVAKP